MRPNLAVLRSALLPMLTETGTVQRSEGFAYNPETGMDEETFTTVYTGAMLIRPRSLDPREVDVGGASWAVSKYDVTLPAGTIVKANDLASIPESDDPELAGATFRLLDVPVDPWTVAVFCPAERNT